jgi:hypothetical protein
MSDDSFIREVNEEVRRDQLRTLWNRYGPWAIGIALAIVLATAAYVAWGHWTEQRANRSGDTFARALDLAESGESEAALAALRALEQDGYGAYPVLARMREATLLADQGDYAGAVGTFDAVAADTAVSPPIRDMARLRAAYILVDHGSYTDVAARAEPLATETHPLRHSAREALGLAAWKAGRHADAQTLFDQTLADGQAPASLRRRAQLMSELIRGRVEPAQ